MAVFSQFVSRLMGAARRESVTSRIVVQCERDVWARMDGYAAASDAAEARGFFRARALRVVQRAMAADPHAAHRVRQLLPEVLERLLTDWITHHAAMPARVPVTRRAA